MEQLMLSPVKLVFRLGAMITNEEWLIDLGYAVTSHICTNKPDGFLGNPFPFRTISNPPKTDPFEGLGSSTPKPKEIGPVPGS